MTSEAIRQQEINKDMNKHIDNVAVAGQLMTQTIPWEHFFENLDHVVESNHCQAMPDASTVANNTQANSSSSGGMSSPKSIKPSARAMYFVNSDKRPNETSQEFMKRAYRIDHALLNAQVKMLQRDVER